MANENNTPGATMAPQDRAALNAKLVAAKAELENCRRRFAPIPEEIDYDIQCATVNIRCACHKLLMADVKERANSAR